MEAQLPSWVSEISVIAVACISVAVAIWRYARTELKKNTPPQIKSTEIVAASFIDSKLLKELIDTIRESDEEYARVSARMVRCNNELRETMLEMIESNRVHVDSHTNLTRFIIRSFNKKGDITDVI